MLTCCQNSARSVVLMPRMRCQHFLRATGVRPASATIWIRGAALVALFACVDPTDSCGCSPVPVATRLQGLVRDRAGASATATVTASARDRACNASAAGVRVIPAAGVLTDSLGGYLLELFSDRVDTACVRLVVRGLTSADTATRDSVRILLGNGGSHRVDLTLP